MKKTSWMNVVYAALFAIVIGGLYLFVAMMFDVARLDQGVLVLEQQVSNLEAQMGALEQGQRSLCQNLLKMSYIDNDLVTLANSQDVPRVGETWNKISASQAYCRDSIFVMIDLRGFSFKVTFMGSEVSNVYFFTAGFYQKVDSNVVVLGPTGNELASFDPTPFLRIGDFMKIWAAKEKPDFCVFYDPNTGLAVSIEHLDGTIELMN